jgi:hypothetical protein
VWSLLGAKLRLHNAAGFSCAPSATLLALVILLSLPAAQSSAVARDAADQSQTSDANQPDYNAGQAAYAAGRFVEALRIWRHAGLMNAQTIAPNGRHSQAAVPLGIEFRASH